MNIRDLRTTVLVICSAVSTHGLAATKATTATASTGIAGTSIPLSILQVSNATGPLAGPDNSLYVTSFAGNYVGSNQSVISQIATDGTATTLHTFSPYDSSDAPNADGDMVTSTLVGTDGDLYGVTVFGGSNSSGTFFRLTPGGSFTTLYSFDFSAFSAVTTDNHVVQGSDGAFYGIAYVDYGNPYVFYKLTADGHYTNLCQWTFTNGPPYGAPTSLQAGSDGNIYGVLWNSVVRLNQTTCGFDPIYTSTSTLGALLVGGDGNFYVSTGAALLKVSPSGTATTLQSYDAITTQVYKSGYWQRTDEGWVWVPGQWLTKDVSISAEGFDPSSYWGADGNLYVATTAQGLNSHGAIFRIAPDGTTTASFSPSNQVFGIDHPLVLGSDGQLRMVEYTSQGTSILQTVAFDSPLSTSISFSNPNVKLGQKTVLSWSSTGAASCQLISDIPLVAKSSVANSGSKSVYIYSTNHRAPASFTAGIQCIAADGSVSNAGTTVSISN